MNGRFKAARRFNASYSATYNSGYIEGPFGPIGKDGHCTVCGVFVRDTIPYENYNRCAPCLERYKRGYDKTVVLNTKRPTVGYG